MTTASNAAVAGERPAKPKCELTEEGLALVSAGKLGLFKTVPEKVEAGRLG